MSSVETIPSPLGGWNTVDSPTEIPSNQAYVLDNLIPGTSSVYTRKGYASWSTSVGSGNVDSLFELRVGTLAKMIAASGGSIYDCSTLGVATSLKSGFVNNQWNGAVFNATLGLVNGVDAPQIYDGSTVTAMTVSGPSDITQINNIITFKNRTYFSVKNSQDFWYSGLSTMGGALTMFPLSKVGNFGGNLIAIQTLTNDGGDGQDDLFCCFMSTGEIIIYNGTDPGSDFVLVGIFRAPRPLTSRAIVKFGPDVFFVTNNGFLTISTLLPLSYGKDNSQLNRFIKGAASTAAASFPTDFGWQVLECPAENLLIVNVPQTNNQFVQYVMNVNTSSWCRFTNINARCWCVFGNDLYFGSNSGVVFKYQTPYTDNGTSITAAYTTPYLSLKAGQSRTSAFRPRFRLDADVAMTVSSSVDFQPWTTPYSVSFSSIGAEWGDPWGSPWAVSNSSIAYLSFNKVGYNVSAAMTFTSAGALDYFKTDFLVGGSSRI